MDWDTGTWRYRNNDNIIKIIENNHVASNLKKNNPFILIFPRKIEEGNNNSDTDIDNSFIKVSGCCHKHVAQTSSSTDGAADKPPEQPEQSY